MYSGITSGRVLDGELLYAIHIYAYAPLRNLYEISMKQSVEKMQTN